MEFEPKRNEFAQEVLASNRLKKAVTEVLAESSDKLLVENRQATRFRSGKMRAQAVCEFDNGLEYLLDYTEESNRKEVYFWRIAITTLDTEHVTHQYRSLVTSEEVVLSNQGVGLPYLYREGPVPNTKGQIPFLFPYGEVAPAEMLEELRQGIRAAYVLPSNEAQDIIDMRALTIDDANELKRISCKSLGAYALFMTGVKWRIFASRITKSGD